MTEHEGVLVVEPLHVPLDVADEDGDFLWHIFRDDETIALCGYRVEPEDHLERANVVDADTCVVCLSLSENEDREDDD